MLLLGGERSTGLFQSDIVIWTHMRPAKTVRASVQRLDVVLKCLSMIFRAPNKGPRHVFQKMPEALR